MAVDQKASQGLRKPTEIMSVEKFILLSSCSLRSVKIANSDIGFIRRSIVCIGLLMFPPFQPVLDAILVDFYCHYYAL